MKKYCLFTLLLLITSLSLQAQKLTVESMTTLPMDLSASQYERKDLAGKPCALVKVQLAATGAQFEGNVIGKVDYKTNEYWVYMSEGSYMLSIKHPSFVPLDVNFRDYGVNGVQGKATYKLTLLMLDQKTQKLTINYTPATAMVIVDSKIYRGNGRIELDLPVGDHNYVIAEDGFDPIEGIARLNATSPRVISETLIRNSTSMDFVQPVAQQFVQAIETFTVNGVSFNMIRVEGGTFMMGYEDGEANREEKPVHQVTLSSYSIGETEVTQELWLAVMGSNPSKFKGNNLPIENVSWEDCQEFTSMLSSLTGRRFRLPTEAEWEFAARGGMKSRGYKYSGSDNVDDVAWYSGNSGKKTHPVKIKLANELGLYDMNGNVNEWCQDRYGKYESDSQVNPTGPSKGSHRVNRGGSWFYRASLCRMRSSLSRSFRTNFLGLRLAM